MKIKDLKFNNLYLVSIGILIFFIYFILLHPITGSLGGLPLFLLGFTILPNASLFLVSFGLVPTSISRVKKIITFLIIYLFMGWCLIASSLYDYDPNLKVVVNNWDLLNGVFYVEGGDPSPYIQKVGFGADAGCGCSYWVYSNGEPSTRENTGLHNNFYSNAFELFGHATIPSYIYLSVSKLIYN